MATTGNEYEIGQSSSFFSVQLVAQSLCADFSLRHPNGINEIKVKFFSTFEHELLENECRMRVKEIQHNSNEIKERISVFVQEFSSLIAEVHGLNTYFRSLRENEPFLIVTAKLEGTDLYKVTKWLEAFETGQSFDELWKGAQKTLGVILNNYSPKVFDDTTKQKIGESKKEKRICRFCNKDAQSTSFRKKAHAISEALGNKSIIVNDECDTCNERFGAGIENAVIAYCRIYLIITGVKGKEGVATLKGKEFKFSNKNGLSLSLPIRQRPLERSAPFSYTLESSESISEQNIYRGLCKFAVSVADTDDLPDLKRTIAWINGDDPQFLLPLVAQQVDSSVNNDKPCIILFKRISNDESLPLFVAELRVSVLRLVFIVPTFTNAESKFSERSIFELFWEKFDFYSGKGAWCFSNWNDSKKKPVIYQLSFSPGCSDLNPKTES